jgi:hypothetical protein
MKTAVCCRQLPDKVWAPHVTSCLWCVCLQVLSSRVFVAVCRGYWDRMAKDVLHFLENRKENMSWVKSASAEMALQVRPASTCCALPPRTSLLASKPLDVRSELAAHETDGVEDAPRTASPGWQAVKRMCCPRLAIIGEADFVYLLSKRSTRSTSRWIVSGAASDRSFCVWQYLDRVFTHHMTQLQGHSLQERDLDAPRSVLEARSMLSKDMPNVEQSYSLF